MKFYGELLVFVLLLITNGRILFVREKRDTLVVLAPVVLVLSILQIIAWGVDVFNVYALLIAVLVFFSNFHAMFRFTSSLYVDHYSVLMKIWASVTIILSLAGIAATVYFRPVEKDSEKLLITETTTKYYGSFTYGFEEAGPFTPSRMELTEFTKYPEIASKKNVLVLIPDKRGDTKNYVPYLQQMARNGFTICSADFYSKDCKWTHNLFDNRLTRSVALTASSLIKNHKFMSQREFYTYNTTLEGRALLKVLTEKYGENTKFFFITDVMANTAIEDLIRENPEKISGYLNLDKLEEYQTAGYGFIQQTNPLLTLYMGLDVDRKGEQLDALVQKSKEEILNQL